MAFGDLWTVEQPAHEGFIYIVDPEGDYRVRVLRGDKRFARALCYILNSTPTHKITATDADMDLRGVPK
jgi:hypothetical protein